jgi:hypothetical protein
MKTGIRCSCRRYRRQNAKDPAADTGARSTGCGVENLPAQTIVVFNTAVPDAESLAKFYAEKRAIPMII